MLLLYPYDISQIYLPPPDQENQALNLAASEQ